MPGIDTITRYLRNGVELDHDSWTAKLNSDMCAHRQQVRRVQECAVMFDLWNRDKVEVNNNIYEVRIDYIFDTAKNVMEEMSKLGHRGECIMLDVLQAIPEDLASQLIPYIPNMRRSDDGKFILEDAGKSSRVVGYNT